jgi:hypothetical protein
MKVLHAAAVGMALLAGQGPAGPIVDDPEAYAVYAAVLALESTGAIEPPATIAIEGRTTAYELCAAWERSLPGGWEAALESYRRENAEVRLLLEGVDLGVPYLLVTSAAYEALLMESTGDANRVYSRFREETSFSFSAVGIDRTNRRAIVMMRRSCEPGCGAGKHVLLEKHDGRWTAIRTEPAAC